MTWRLVYTPIIPGPDKSLELFLQEGVLKALWA